MFFRSKKKSATNSMVAPQPDLAQVDSRVGEGVVSDHKQSSQGTATQTMASAPSSQVHAQQTEQPVSKPQISMPEAQSATPVRSNASVDRDRQAAAALADLIAVLMNSQAHRNRTLAELETSLRPAIHARQFAVAGRRDQVTNRNQPHAAIIWARVSDEISAKLLNGGDVKLQGNDWCSGRNVWIVDEIGDPKLLKMLNEQLQTSVWKDQAVRKVGAPQPLAATVAQSA